MVKCLAQGHKCQDLESIQHSAAGSTRVWIRYWTRQLSHDTPENVDCVESLLALPYDSEKQESILSLAIKGDKGIE